MSLSQAIHLLYSCLYSNTGASKGFGDSFREIAEGQIDRKHTNVLLNNIKIATCIHAKIEVSKKVNMNVNMCLHILTW